MRTKITFASFALVLAALASSTAMAQQPTISIADSTGRRDAVVAIVIPPPVDLSNLTRTAAEQAQPLPWTARFIGQTKGNFRITQDGSVELYDQSWRVFSKVFDLPVWNEVLRRSSSYTRGGCGGGNKGGTPTPVTTTISAVPLGLTVTNRIPSDWTASVVVSGDGGCRP